MRLNLINCGNSVYMIVFKKFMSKKMPQKIASLDLQKQDDIYKLPDNVVKTGIPIEFYRTGKRLVIDFAEKKRNLASLIKLIYS